MNFINERRHESHSVRRDIAEMKRWLIKPFREVIGNRVSDNYARNIYSKVFLKIAVSWILTTSKILVKTLAKLLENTYNK